MDKPFHSTLYDGQTYLSLLGLKLIHVSKGGPRQQDISRAMLALHTDGLTMIVSTSVKCFYKLISNENKTKTE